MVTDATNGSAAPRNRKPRVDREQWRHGGAQYSNTAEYSDASSAARFFPALPFAPEDADPVCYCPKAGKRERGGSSHPTMKPVALMRWLVRLVTPPGGTVLDPYMGSGTTGVAAVREGFGFIGMEQDEEYMGIARARIRNAGTQH